MLVIENKTSPEHGLQLSVDITVMGFVSYFPCKWAMILESLRAQKCQVI